MTNLFQFVSIVIGTGEDPDSGNPGDGGGTGAHGGGGIMNMPECDPCTMPNPPTHCYDDEEEPEPCDTGNELVDSDSVQQGMMQIWSNSNPDSDINDRREDGGFIIKNGDEYTFQRFPPGWPRMACGIGSPSLLTYNLPANTVGWIHTHPYEIGEDIGSICYDDGREAPYPGYASISDKQTTRICYLMQCLRDS